MTTTQTQSNGRLLAALNTMNEQIAAGVPEVLAELLFSAEQAVEDADRQLAQAARKVQDRAASVLSAVEKGHHVNSLGELQQAGPDLDRACALRQAAVENRNRLVGAIRRSQEAVQA